MAKTDNPAPPAADPRRGRNPGYAENQPRDRGDAQQPAAPSQPNPDEPGIRRDPDPPPDPADGPDDDPDTSE